MSEDIDTPLRDQFAERIYNAIGGDQADRIMRMFDWAVQDAAAREPVAPAEVLDAFGELLTCAANYRRRPVKWDERLALAIHNGGRTLAAAREAVAPAGHTHYKGWCNKCLDEGGRIREGDEPVAPAEAESPDPFLDLDGDREAQRALAQPPAPVSAETAWDTVRTALYATGMPRRERDAIEAAIRGTTPLDAERLARALMSTWYVGADGEFRMAARTIAAEYDRLALRGQPSETP